MFKAYLVSGIPGKHRSVYSWAGCVWSSDGREMTAFGRACLALVRRNGLSIGFLCCILIYVVYRIGVPIPLFTISELYRPMDLIEDEAAALHSVLGFKAWCNRPRTCC